MSESELAPESVASSDRRAGRFLDAPEGSFEHAPQGSASSKKDRRLANWRSYFYPRSRARRISMSAPDMNPLPIRYKDRRRLCTSFGYRTNKDVRSEQILKLQLLNRSIRIMQDEMTHDGMASRSCFCD